MCKGPVLLENGCWAKTSFHGIDREPLNQLASLDLRKRGGAPRNPAPRNHFFGGLPNHVQIIIFIKMFSSISLAACAKNTVE